MKTDERKIKTKIGNLIIQGLGVLALLLLGIPQYASAAAACGPGAHWVDNCPSGLDLGNSTAQHVVVLSPFGTFPGGTFDGTLSGPTTIRRSAGTTVPNHHIDTEIVSLNLTGGGLTLIAGAGLGTPTPGLPASTGQIIEQAGNPSLADSFFNVFFELQGPFPFGPLRNELANPAHMTVTGLTQVPPPLFTMYFADNLPIPIFSAGADGIFYTADDVQRGFLTSATHTFPIPEPETYGMMLAGLSLLSWWSKRRKRV